MHLCEQESNLRLNASGHLTREGKASLQKACDLLGGCEQTDAGVDGCMCVLPLALMYPTCTTGVTQDEPHRAVMLWVTSTESTLYALCISSQYTQCVQCRCYKVRYLPSSWKMCKPQAGQSLVAIPTPCSPLLLFLCTCLLAVGKVAFTHVSKLRVREVAAKRLLEESLWINTLCRSTEIWSQLPAIWKPLSWTMHVFFLPPCVIVS